MIGEKAKASKYAPFAVILDCVGGTEVIPYMDELLIEDPKHPELGVYVSISGDSKSVSIILFIISIQADIYSVSRRTNEFRSSNRESLSTDI